MKQILAITLCLSVNAAWADTACFPVGATLTIYGDSVREGASLSDGSRSSTPSLSLNPPLCVIDKRASQDSYGRISVTRLQLIGPPPPPGVRLGVTGMLNSASKGSYYMAPTSVWVAPPVRQPK
jgi:hypothetical protein